MYEGKVGLTKDFVFAPLPSDGLARLRAQVTNVRVGGGTSTVQCRCVWIRFSCRQRIRGGLGWRGLIGEMGNLSVLASKGR